MFFLVILIKKMQTREVRLSRLVEDNGIVHDAPADRAEERVGDLLSQCYFWKVKIMHFLEIEIFPFGTNCFETPGASSMEMSSFSSSRAMVLVG